MGIIVILCVKRNMRIIVACHSLRRIGGVEAYLDALIPRLIEQGHTLGLLHEQEGPSKHPSIEASLVSRLPIARGEYDGARKLVASFGPDIIYCNGLTDVRLEKEIQGLAPSVAYVHGFYGSCISGIKATRFPRRQICCRSFGWTCLARYHILGCGGLSPVSMWREFSLQSERKCVLRQYRSVLTNSRYMASELAKYEISAEPVPLFPAGAPHKALFPPLPSGEQPWRLLFLGRMTKIKGGAVFLNALPRVAARLGRSLHITFAGDGPERVAWEKAAGQLAQRYGDVEFCFPGWLRDTTEVLRNSHLLVIPSIWPEPFGLVGIEAGRFSVPSVAFAVGGIPEWLKDGVNGRVAPGKELNEVALADAIVGVLEDPAVYLQMCHGAREESNRFSVERHVQQLVSVFEQCIAKKSSRLNSIKAAPTMAVAAESSI